MIVIGIDMAFANMGLVRARLDVIAGRFYPLDLFLVSTEGDGKKRVVRKSSEELRRAKELVAGLTSFCSGANLAFAEVPSGSQDASAARALGIAVGALASCPIPIVEVSPQEVKIAATGDKTAKKLDMINWATTKWPGLDWPRHGGKPTMSKCEHLADALGAIEAGLRTDEFKRLVSTMRAMAPAVPRKRPTTR